MKQKNTEYTERASHSWTKDSIRLMLTPGKTAKAIYFYAQECGYFKTDTTYFTERKGLNSFLIVYTISGKGTLKYREQTYSLTSGSCFFIDCMEYNYYETAQNRNWEFLWIHFNGSTARGYFEEFTKNGFQVIDIQDTFLIESSMRRIVSLNQKRNASTEVLTSGLISSILTELLVQTITGNAPSIYLPQYLKNILKDIDRNFKAPLSLDSLASAHGVSKFHLSREFKKFMGSTVGEYIIETRLAYAKELLKYSNKPVSEITFETGMNNVSHFINLFKAREGVTPLAYRKEWQT